MVSTDKVEFGGLFHNGKTDVTLLITTNEIGFTQPPTKIKNYNSSDEDVITSTDRQIVSKKMDIILYWMKDLVKQNYFFVYQKLVCQNMGDYFTKHHPPHHHK